jgi:DNA polymerase II small subunit/DNA polymerase delta subunit B
MKEKEPLSEFKKLFEQSKDGQKKIAQLEQENKQLKTIVKKHVQDQKKIIIKSKSKTDKIKFGVIGDTHLGSLCEKIDYLNIYYNELEERGITTVLCAGDLIDGWNIYKGQLFEQHKRGWKEQKSWFVEQFPVRQNIKTKFITGNHDSSFTKTVDIEVGKELAAAREDLEFIGEDIGDVYFQVPGSDKQCKVTLIHPDGGTAYALSYKPQKIIEQLEGGSKPHLLVIGHFHKAEFLPNYRNVACLQAGTFQSQTPFMKRKGLSAMMGGWIVEAEILDEYNIFKTEFVSFYYK